MRETLRLMAGEPRTQATAFVSSPEGLAAVRFPATCDESCSYTGQGEVTAVWASLGDLAKLQHATFLPGAQARGEVVAHVLGDGSLLASLGQQAFVVDAGGVKTTFPLRDRSAFDLVKIGGETLALDGFVELRRPARFDTRMAWALGGGDPERDVFFAEEEPTKALASAGRSQPLPCASRGRASTIASSGSPSRASRPSRRRSTRSTCRPVFATLPLPACDRAEIRGSMRLVVSVPGDLRVSIRKPEWEYAPPPHLVIRRAVVVGPPREGVACVRALVATDAEVMPRWEVAVYRTTSPTRSACSATCPPTASSDAPVACEWASPGP